MQLLDGGIADYVAGTAKLEAGGKLLPCDLLAVRARFAHDRLQELKDLRHRVGAAAPVVPFRLIQEHSNPSNIPCFLAHIRTRFELHACGCECLPCLRAPVAGGEDDAQLVLQAARRSTALSSRRSSAAA